MNIRTSPIAGSWYEGTKERLENQILECAHSEFGVGYDFSEEKDVEKRYLVGVVSPHAGYRYSGPTATHAYAMIRNMYPHLQRIIVVGPDHRGYGSGISFYPEGAWKTPLGEASIDLKLLSLAQKDEIHANFSVRDHSEEHSIDIQIPMFQFAYRRVDQPSFFPIMITRQSLKKAKEVGGFIARAIKATEQTVVVASSDFSHEYDYDRLMMNDREMLRILCTGDIEEAEEFRKQVDMTMCGFAPVFSLIHAAQLLADDKRVIVEKLSYSNSAMVTGMKGNHYTVGYASLAVFISE